MPISLRSGRSGVTTCSMIAITQTSPSISSSTGMTAGITENSQSSAPSTRAYVMPTERSPHGSLSTSRKGGFLHTDDELAMILNKSRTPFSPPTCKLPAPVKSRMAGSFRDGAPQVCYTDGSAQCGNMPLQGLYRHWSDILGRCLNFFDATLQPTVFRNTNPRQPARYP